MLIGDKKDFAIEIELLDIVDSWIFGTFIFWLAGEIVGDLDDKSVDLNGCVNWLRDFAESPRNRFEPGLFDMDIGRAFMFLNFSVIRGKQAGIFPKEPYSSVYSRFHIEYIGMSSFNDVKALLIEDEAQRQRCIWQQGKNEVKEVFLPKGTMQNIALGAVQCFEEKKGVCHRI